jgi:hypothetical protein
MPKYPQLTFVSYYEQQLRLVSAVVEELAEKVPLLAVEGEEVVVVVVAEGWMYRVLSLTDLAH